MWIHNIKFWFAHLNKGFNINPQPISLPKSLLQTEICLARLFTKTHIHLLCRQMKCANFFSCKVHLQVARCKIGSQN